MYNWSDRIKSAIIGIVKSRLSVVVIVFCIMTAILVQRVFVLQIVNGQRYLDDYKLMIQKTREVQGTRGRILDRNGVVLADNVLAYSVTIEDDGEYDERSEKNKVLNSTIERIIQITEKNGDTMVNNFNIGVNEKDEYEYLVDGTKKLRFLADVFGYATIDKLKKKADYTAEQVITYLCTDKRYGYGIDLKKNTKAQVLQLVNVRYAVGLNSFQKFLETTIATNVSEETVAEIKENQDKLQGVSIKEDALRKYNNAEYFSSVLGYTGKISKEEFDALDKETAKSYALTDIIGKSGIEQEMDQTLQGQKGSVKLYVDNVGKVIDRVEDKKAAAGDDVFLTLDANLQIAAYNILEEKIAGILLSKLTNSLSFDRSQVQDSEDVVVPIGDVYHSFFGNDIIDTDHFVEESAQDTEKAVHASFSSARDKAVDMILSDLANPSGSAYNDLSAELKAYEDFISGQMLSNQAGILLKKEIDTSDATYLAWTEGTISLHEYLNYAISQNWIDSSKLKDYISAKSSYSDLGEVYQGILNYLSEELKTNKAFEKLVYKFMIRSGTITGTQVCLLLYEQGILKRDEQQIQMLKAGAVGPYEFIRSKIEALEITPGQIGLEPCTGSFVMTDANSGDVLASVSYPGYDNNRLANSNDNAYFAQLSSNFASPLYNKATQERTAPGSTYKPLSAIAGLTEGVVDTGTAVVCTGVFDRIQPSPKCWIYPGSHGSLAVSQAITESCNDYFYEVGYRLGLENAQDKLVLSNDTGLLKLRKYATLFGLNEKTGIEIPETEGKISDEDTVRSAIGQGTNNYTTTQLARYIGAVANRGTLYNLSLLEKVTDVAGKTVKEYEPQDPVKIEGITDSTWNAVHRGMRGVVAESAVYSSVNNAGFEFSGKTGTAQQSKTHADHALFVGFAPSSSPEVAFACRIANGYASQYTSEVARDVIRYYYGLSEDVVTGRAAAVDTNTSGD